MPNSDSRIENGSRRVEGAMKLRDISTYGLEDKQEAEPTAPRRTFQWYCHILMVFFVEFSGESSRGLTLPSLYLYNVSLGGDLASMAVMTSLFSLGRLISSTVLGWMSDRFSFRWVYIISAVICIIGNLLYMTADKHVGDSIFLLHASRFIVGFGAGNRSVCRANVAALTRTDQRLRYLTWLSLVVFLGFAVTPGIGKYVSEVDFWVFTHHINKYTSPCKITSPF